MQHDLREFDQDVLHHIYVAQKMPPLSNVDLPYIQVMCVLTYEVKLGSFSH